MSTQRVELQGGSDLIKARLAARDLAGRAGLGVMDQTRFATAVSELARNALRYARGGACELIDLSEPGTVRLEARISDQGPGIDDIDQAMREGYSSSGSLGAGLPGARRLVDQFAIDSSPQGTLVRIQIIRRSRT